MLKPSQNVAITRCGQHRRATTAGRDRHFPASIATALIWALVLAAATFTASAADVYKWVDENGVTHYSAQPPATERHYEEVKVRRRGGYQTTGTPQPAPQQGASDDAAESKEEDDRLTRPGAEITVKNPDKVAANCERARNNIATIESRRRVLLDDGQGGQRRLSDEERAALMKESQDYLERWCRDQ